MTPPLDQTKQLTFFIFKSIVKTLALIDCIFSPEPLSFSLYFLSRHCRISFTQILFYRTIKEIIFFLLPIEITFVIPDKR